MYTHTRIIDFRLNFDSVSINVSNRHTNRAPHERTNGGGGSKADNFLGKLVKNFNKKWSRREEVKCATLCSRDRLCQSHTRVRYESLHCYKKGLTGPTCQSDVYQWIKYIHAHYSGQFFGWFIRKRDKNRQRFQNCIIPLHSMCLHSQGRRAACNARQ